MKEFDFTEEEKELIFAIRNYHKSYPNGKKELLRFARSLFREMTQRKKP